MPTNSAPIACITGATGYLGSRLARHLLQQGWTVHALVRDPAKALFEGVQAHAIAEDLSPILKQVRPRVVFHLASLFLADHKPEQVKPLLDSNVLFGSQLLEAMHAAQVPYLVNAGTWWQHYENQVYSPTSLYAATKQAFEAIVDFYVQARGLRAITLKIFDSYGPDDPRPKLINILLKTLKEPRPMEFPKGEQPLDLVHADDLARAFAHAAGLLDQGTISGHGRYALPAQERLSLRETVELFYRVACVTPAISWGARPYRSREMMTAWTDAVPLPGWQANIGIEEGFRELIGASQQFGERGASAP